MALFFSNSINPLVSTEVVTLDIKKRNPLHAFLLSVIAPGVGQIYNGQLVKGILFFIIRFSLIYLVALTGLQYTLNGLIFIIIVSFLFTVLILVDATVTAWNSNVIVLKKYQRWYYYALMIVVAVILSLTGSVTNTLGIKTVEVLGAAMEPSLQSNDKVVVDIKNRSFSRGDIILFSENDKTYIKRMVGLEGDKLEMSNGNLLVNNQIIEEDYILDQAYSGEYSEIKIPNGHVFVLGDNRANSRDSREFGPIPIEKITSVV